MSNVNLRLYPGDEAILNRVTKETAIKNAKAKAGWYQVEALGGGIPNNLTVGGIVKLEAEVTLSNNASLIPLKETEMIAVNSFSLSHEKEEQTVKVWSQSTAISVGSSSTASSGSIGGYFTGDDALYKEIQSQFIDSFDQRESNIKTGKANSDTIFVLFHKNSRTAKSGEQITSYFLPLKFNTLNEEVSESNTQEITIDFTVDGAGKPSIIYWTVQ